MPPKEKDKASPKKKKSATGDDGDGKKARKPKGKGKKALKPPPIEDPGTPQSPMGELEMEQDGVEQDFRAPINPPQSQVAAFLREQKAKRKPHVLDFDPRTELPLITPPPSYQAAFNALVGERDPILLHIFEEVEMHNGEGEDPQLVILMITDQTLYLCSPEAEALRAVQVDQIQRVDMTLPDGNEVAIVGPPHDYDMYLRFLRADGRVARSNAMKSLHLVYKRMTGGRTIDVQSPISDPSTYRLRQPEDYKIVLHPQRTKAHLQKALENFDRQEDETLRWVEELQNELEAEHRDKIKLKDDQINNILTQLEEAQAAQRAQSDEIARLQHIYGIAVGQDEMAFDDLDPKDRKIMELEMALRDIQERTELEAHRLHEIDMAGNFFERDLSHEIKPDPTRPRGRSLHMQGLVEVLQRQVRERNRDVDDLQDQLKEVDTLRKQLREKDATIKALQAQAESAGGVGVPETDFHAMPFTGPSPYVSVPDHPYNPFEANGHDLGGGPHSHGQLMPSSYEPGYSAYPTETVRTMPTEGLDDMEPFVRKPYATHEHPRTADEMTVHPITGLKLVETPPELAKPFMDLKGATVHMFQQVLQYDKNGKKKQKILIITDKCMYVCDKKGIISKCNTIADVAKLITDDRTNLGIRFHETAHDSDLMVEFPTQGARDEARHIIMTVQKYGEGNLTMAHVGQLEPGHVNFKKPAGYELRLRGLTSKQSVFRLLDETEKRKRVQHEMEQNKLEEEYGKRRQQSMVAAASEEAYKQNMQAMQDAYTRQALEGLKHELRAEFAAKKDAEYQRLKAQIKSLEQENNDKMDELSRVKEQWIGHRCHRLAPQPHIPSKQTEGLYWIPTEPVVLECQLQVLKVQFWDNILITSHANGFLNVWDIDTAECIRTLKDHTAKVVAFQYDGVELVSGSYDSTIRRWNVADGSCLNVVAAHKGQITCLQFDRNILISGSTDTTIQVWQMDIELRNLKTLRGHKATVQSLRFERDVLVSAEWGWLFVWDLTTGFVIKALRDEQGGITCIDYNNIFMVTGGHAGALTMWDVSTGDYETLYGHTDDITHIQIEGPYAVTSSTDCTIRMWDLQNFKSLGVFNNSYPHECRTFQFIANRFVAVEDKSVKIWTK